MKRSQHKVCGVEFMIDWREVQPKDWRIYCVTVKGPKVHDELPPELETRASQVNTIVDGYFKGLTDPLPTDLLDYESHPWSDKRKMIMETLRSKVPRGTVITYGYLGKAAGLGHAAGRPVGNAMAVNPFAFFYPCHRVVRCDYTLGNYGLGGTKVKERLLQMEGVSITNGCCKRPH